MPKKSLATLIAANKKKKDPYLDLGNLQLNGTEPEWEQLKDFYWVETLVLCNYNRESAGVQGYLSLMSDTFSKNKGKPNVLEKIPVLPPKLKKLLAYGQKYIKDISNLALAPEISYLSLYEACPQDHSALEALKELRYANLIACQMQNLKPLRFASKAQKLELAGNSIESADGLENMKELQDLSLVNNKLSDLRALRQLPQLKKLSIGHNPLSHLKDIEPLAELEEFFCTRTRLKADDFETLASKTHLQVLYLPQNGIKSIEFLKNMLKMRQLSLDSNYIQDISPLQNMMGLEELSLMDNPIAETQYILNNFKKISYLNIKNCQVDSLSFAKNMQELTYISASFNPISDLKPLLQHKKLRNIYIEGTPLAKTIANTLGVSEKTMYQMSKVEAYMQLLRKQEDA